MIDLNRYRNKFSPGTSDKDIADNVYDSLNLGGLTSRDRFREMAGIKPEPQPTRKSRQGLHVPDTGPRSLLGVGQGETSKSLLEGRSPISLDQQGIFTDIARGFEGGLRQVQSSIQHGMGALITGSDSSLQKYQEAQQKTAERGMTTPEFTDIPQYDEQGNLDSRETARRAGRWLAGTSAQMVPVVGSIMLGAVLGGKAAGLVGAGMGTKALLAAFRGAPGFMQRSAGLTANVLRSPQAAQQAVKAFAGSTMGSFSVGYGLYAGGMYGDIRGMGADHEDARKAALIYGAPASAVSIVMPMWAGAGVMGMMGKQWTQQRMKGMLRDAGIGTVMEGVAEAMAESFVIMGEESVFGNIYSQEEKNHRIFNAAMAGGLMGGVTGGARGFKGKPTADMNEMTQAFLDSIDEAAPLRDPMVRQYLIDGLEQTERSDDKSALLRYFETGLGDSDAPLNREHERMHQMGIEVRNRGDEANLERAMELNEKLEAGELTADEALERAAIYANSPPMQQEHIDALKDQSEGIPTIEQAQKGVSQIREALSKSEDIAEIDTLTKQLETAEAELEKSTNFHGPLDELNEQIKAARDSIKKGEGDPQDLKTLLEAKQKTEKQQSDIINKERDARLKQIDAVAEKFAAGKDLSEAEQQLYAENADVVWGKAHQIQFGKEIKDRIDKQLGREFSELAGNIEVHRDASTLPKKAHEDHGENVVNVDAFYADGKIHVNAASPTFKDMNPQTLRDKMVHEGFVHMGLDLLDKSRKAEIGQSIYKTLSKKEAESIAKQQGLKADDHAAIGEEWLAYQAERVMREGKTDTVWAQLSKMIRKTLRDLGLNVKYSDLEIAEIVQEGEAGVRRRIETNKATQAKLAQENAAYEEMMVQSDLMLEQHGAEAHAAWKAEKEEIWGQTLESIQEMYAKNQKKIEFEAKEQERLERRLFSPDRLKIESLTSEVEALQAKVEQGKPTTKEADRIAKEIADKQKEIGNIEYWENLAAHERTELLTGLGLSERYAETAFAKLPDKVRAEIAGQRETGWGALDKPKPKTEVKPEPPTGPRTGTPYTQAAPAKDAPPFDAAEVKAEIAANEKKLDNLAGLLKEGKKGSPAHIATEQKITAISETLEGLYGVLEQHDIGHEGTPPAERSQKPVEATSDVDTAIGIQEAETAATGDWVEEGGEFLLRGADDTLEFAVSQAKDGKWTLEKLIDGEESKHGYATAEDAMADKDTAFAPEAISDAELKAKMDENLAALSAAKTGEDQVKKVLTGGKEAALLRGIEMLKNAPDSDQYKAAVAKLEEYRASDEYLAEKAAAQKPKGGGLFSSTKKKKLEAPVEPVAEAAAASEKPATLTENFRDHFLAGKSFNNIVAARKFASEILGEPVVPGTPLTKQVNEAIETGVVMAARQTVSEMRTQGKSDVEIYKALTDLYSRQPNLSTRTSESVLNQAYSTPVPLAFLASHLAGVTQNTSVYEPTAGNGMLLIEANPKKTVANEIDPNRVANLKSVGFSATTKDATTIKPTGEVDIVIANPPFGKVKEIIGSNKTWKIGEFKTTEIDHAIALKALQSLQPGGRAVIILGGKQGGEATRQVKYQARPYVHFYNQLMTNYKIADHFSVDGSLYTKQGASYPIDMIVIEGKGKTEGRLFPGHTPPRIYDSFQSMEALINERPTISEVGTVLGTEGEPVPVDTTASSSDGDQGQRPRNQPVSGDAAVGDTTGGQPPAERGGVPGGVGGRGADRTDVVDRPGEAVEGGQEGVEQPVSPTSDVADTGTAGRGDVSDKDKTGQGSEAGVSRPDVHGESKGDNISHQVTTVVASAAETLDTVVPVNLAEPLAESLKTFKKKHGNIDDYVSKILGYTKDDLYKAFKAEQIDAIGLALDNLEVGDGFINGDQTGIGKGRTVGAVIKYANKTDRIPVFMTAKSKLYADMMRDLSDIGMKEFKPLLTNTGMNGPKAIPLKDGGELSTQSKAKHEAIYRTVLSDGMGEYNAIFTTYDQLNGASARRDFLDNIAPNAMFILDESHLAGADKETAEGKVSSRSEFIRELLAKSPHGAYYASATYAKRPDMMSLYFKTDLRYAVDDILQLAATMKAGGNPMQEVVAGMLAKAGQSVRRERTFEGVSVNTVGAEIDTVVVDDAATVMTGILEFSNIMDDVIKAGTAGGVGGGTTIHGNASAGEQGAQSTGFSSIMHNLISQFLLAVKTPAAVEKAIDSLKRGEKPILTVANTMGSFLKEHVLDNNLKQGDVVDLNFRNMFQRYLDKQRTVREEDAGGNWVSRYIPDDELDADALFIYQKVKDTIDHMEFPTAPISPIDYMKSALAKEGYKFGEITGRDLTIDYSGEKPVLSKRVKSEAADIERVNQYNNNTEYHGLIINQSAAAGLSMHADEKFLDQRKRNMIVVQAELNIDTFKQIFGRIFRTGQVINPSYEILISNLPMEKRPAAVLSKKLASLNANTTGGQKSDMSVKDASDFINDYGDMAATNVMLENPDINRRIGSPVDLETIQRRRARGTSSELDGRTAMAFIPDSMRKVTGKIPLLPAKEQAELYEMLERAYEDEIRQLDSMGINTLEAKTVPLDAKLINSTVISPARNVGKKTPFAEEARLEKYNVKRLGKPYTSAKLKELLANNLRHKEKPSLITSPEVITKKTAKAHAQKTVKSLIKEVTAYWRKVSDETMHRAERVGAAHAELAIERLEQQYEGVMEMFSRVSDMINRFPIGEPVRVGFYEGLFHFEGIVLDVRRKGKAMNPAAPSRWYMKIAVADASKQVEVPFSKINKQTDLTNTDISLDNMATEMDNLYAEFDEGQRDRRDERHIVTGNLLAGFENVEAQGQIVHFTTHDGKTKPGILMSESFHAESHLEAMDIYVPSTAKALEFFDRTSGRGMLKSKDGQFTIIKDYDGSFRLSAPASRKHGGKYYANRELIAAAGSGFTEAGAYQRVTVNRSQMAAVLDVLRKQGIGIIVNSERGIAQELFGAGRTTAGTADARYSMASERAKTADKGLLNKAQEMKTKGTSRRDVWDKTGWWEIVPEQWAFEIDSSSVEIKPGYKDVVSGVPGITELFQGKGLDKLMENYPALLNKVGVFLEIRAKNDDTGSFRKSGNGYVVEIDATSTEKAKSIFLHEIQHAIQEYEGTGQGGSPDNVPTRMGLHPEADKLYAEAQALTKKAMDEEDGVKRAELFKEAVTKEKNAHKIASNVAYKLLTGEAEARLVQKRMDMTPAQRKSDPPWLTLKKMLQEEGLLKEGQKPEDVLITRKDDAKYSMAGARAETADKGLLNKAHEMKAAGTSRRDVWDKTGWWEIVPGQWAFEVDPSKAKLKNMTTEKGQRWGNVIESVTDNAIAEGKQHLTLRDVIGFPAIFQAYPTIGNLPVGIENGDGAAYVRSSTHEPARIDVGQDVKMDDFKSLILHEVQHAVQEHEGSAQGGSVMVAALNPEHYNPEYKKIKDEIHELSMADTGRLGELESKRYKDGLKVPELEQLDKLKKNHPVIGPLIEKGKTLLKEKKPLDTYRSLTGEAEARLVQKRMNMKPGQRKSDPPWLTLKKMLQEEGLLKEGQKPEDVLITRKDDGRYSMAAPETKEFKSWFGKSKAVMPDGRPQPFFHGTYGDFNEFRPSELTGGLMFFTISPKRASGYAMGEHTGYQAKYDGEIGSVMPVWLRAENPAGTKAKPIHWREAENNGAEYYKKQGYDSVYVSEGKNWTMAVFDANQIKSATGNTGEFSRDSDDIRYSIVTDKKLLKKLESGPKKLLYRAMQVIDDKLYPVMSAKVKGKLREPINIGQWVKSDEDATDVKDGFFPLEKGDKTSPMSVRYNPYWHTSASMLNDQFATANRRDNIVMVEAEIPESDLASGYHADKAKDPVGEMDWNEGPVAAQLAKRGKKRSVFLSQYMKVKRIIPDSEVASHIAKLMEGEKDITIPWENVTPEVRTELEKLGVPISKGAPILGVIEGKGGKFSANIPGAVVNFEVSDGSMYMKDTVSDPKAVGTTTFTKLLDEILDKHTSGVNEVWAAAASQGSMGSVLEKAGFELVRNNRQKKIEVPKQVDVRANIYKMDIRYSISKAEPSALAENKTGSEHYAAKLPGGEIEFEITPDGKLYMHDALTDPEFRGQGIATKLVNEILEKYTGEVDEMWSAAASPGMARILERAGFQLVREKKKTKPEVPAPVAFDNTDVYKMDTAARYSISQTPQEALVLNLPGFRGVGIAGTIKNALLRSVESATDRLRRSGNKDAMDLATKVDGYFDSREKRMGFWNGGLQKHLKNVKWRESKQFMRDFEEYWQHHDNGRDAEANAVLARSHAELKPFVDTVKQLFHKAGIENQRLGIQVIGEGGKPRLIGKLNEGEFWPRMLRPNVQRALKEQDYRLLNKEGKQLWSEMVKALMDGGHITQVDEALSFLNNHFSDEIANDYFAGVEKARGEIKMPEMFYDYSYETLKRYATKWSTRVSQIEHFGQDIKEQGDAFDAIFKTSMKPSDKRYIEQIKGLVYENKTHDAHLTFIDYANIFATGAQLGNPATAVLNLLGGSTLNWQMFGMKHWLRSFVEMAKDWKAIQQRGADYGILGKDVMNIMNDTERHAGKYFEESSRVRNWLQKFANTTMTWGGYKVTENFIRSQAMVAAEMQLKDALHLWSNKPNSADAAAYRKMMQTNNIDANKLITESGSGEETAKYLRKMVNIPQGSYRIDQTPVFVDTQLGRFFWKYQKFGTQVSRMFYDNMFRPLAEAKTPEARAKAAMNMLAFFGKAFIGGTFILAARGALFGYKDPGPDEKDVLQAFKNDDTHKAFMLLSSRAFHNMMAASMLGFYGNYINFTLDVTDRQRPKNPFDPPALASINGMQQLVLGYMDQGTLTARDLDNVLQGQLSIYRGYKRAAANISSAVGSEWKEAQLASFGKERQYARGVTNRYAKENDIERRRQRSGIPVKTPRSPMNQKLFEALATGNHEAARVIMQESMAGMNRQERQNLMQSMRASVAQRQPLAISGSLSRQERINFYKWARENLEPGNFNRVREADFRYRQAAMRAGLMTQIGFIPRPIQE